MSLQIKKILITGGSGFIGKNFIDRFSNQYTLANISRQKSHELQAKHYSGSLADGPFLQSVFDDFKPDALLHLAGSRNRSLSWEALDENINENILYTFSLLKNAHKSGLQKTILIGSGDEYGINETPFTEEQYPLPSSPYAFSKSTLAHLSLLLKKLGLMDCLFLRPSLIYGPGQADDMFISHAIRSLANGHEFNMTSGTQTRDFIFIDDFTDCLHLAFQSSGPHDVIYNVSSQTEMAIRDVAEMIGNKLQASHLLKVGAKKDRPHETSSYCLSHAKAMAKFNWSPQVSLSEGLDKTISAFTGR